MSNNFNARSTPATPAAPIKAGSHGLDKANPSQRDNMQKSSATPANKQGQQQNARPAWDANANKRQDDKRDDRR